MNLRPSPTPDLHLFLRPFTPVHNVPQPPPPHLLPNPNLDCAPNPNRHKPLQYTTHWPQTHALCLLPPKAVVSAEAARASNLGTEVAALTAKLASLEGNMQGLSSEVDEWRAR